MIRLKSSAIAVLSILIVLLGSATIYGLNRVNKNQKLVEGETFSMPTGSGPLVSPVFISNEDTDVTDSGLGQLGGTASTNPGIGGAVSRYPSTGGEAVSDGGAVWTDPSEGSSGGTSGQTGRGVVGTGKGDGIANSDPGEESSQTDPGVTEPDAPGDTTGGGTEDVEVVTSGGIEGDVGTLHDPYGHMSVDQFLQITKPGTLTLGRVMPSILMLAFSLLTLVIAVTIRKQSEDRARIFNIEGLKALLESSKSSGASVILVLVAAFVIALASFGIARESKDPTEVGLLGAGFVSFCFVATAIYNCVCAWGFAANANARISSVKPKSKPLSQAPALLTVLVGISQILGQNSTFLSNFVAMFSRN